MQAFLCKRVVLHTHTHKHTHTLSLTHSHTHNMNKHISHPFSLRQKRCPVPSQTYHLHYEDSESPKAQHTPDESCCCIFQADPRQLNEIIGNLAAKVDKVTFIPDAGRLKLKSWMDEEDVKNNLSTECAVDTRDFLKYHYNSQTPFTKTFQLKEFKVPPPCPSYSGRRDCITLVSDLIRYEM